MKNHKLHSTVGEQPVEEPEIKYPRMMRHTLSHSITLFSEQWRGVRLHKGGGKLEVGEIVQFDSQDGYFVLHNGPVTITGTDIN